MFQPTINYDFLPISVYWKDKDGKYLGHNIFAFKKLLDYGFEKATSTKDDIIGKTDYDLFPEVFAEQYRQNDLIVIKNGEELIKEEIVVTPAKLKLVQLSSKGPLLNSKNEICGIIGITFDLTSLRATSTHSIFIQLFKHFGLSQREAECLYVLMTGLTMKQIAYTLNLSPKTVEHYLNKVKQKLKCESRSNLIAKALHMAQLIPLR